MPTSDIKSPNAHAAVDRLDLSIASARDGRAPGGGALGADPANLACYTCCGFGVRGCACFEGE